MTYREWASKNNPGIIDDTTRWGGVVGCPHQYLYDAEIPEYCSECVAVADACSRCWDREIPGTEADPYIKDSGDRTKFDTGAVRDMREGKGRCDLMPLEVISRFYEKYHPGEWVHTTFWRLGTFLKTHDTVHLYDALQEYRIQLGYNDYETMFLEVSKHFEDGAKKYGENNWQKGIPIHCYIDSAVRHYLKWLRGDKDEPHDRAFVWNLLCCIWEVDYHSKDTKSEEVTTNAK